MLCDGNHEVSNVVPIKNMELKYLIECIITQEKVLFLYTKARGYHKKKV